MEIKALFLDFYGTVVHEDDEVIPVICDKISRTSSVECDVREIGQFWWDGFSASLRNSYGLTFETQRTLEIKSLHETIKHYQSSCNAEEVIKKQFDHWQKPGIFEDSKPFIKSQNIPVYIISNIDSEDLKSALKYHELEVDGMITSEDVRAYKPRSEIFVEALRRFHLMNTEVLHVGDSLTSDVLGAQKVGIQAAWMNRVGKNKPDHIQPDYICKDFNELKTKIFR